MVGGVVAAEAFARGSEGQAGLLGYARYGVEDDSLGHKVITVVAVARGYAVADFVEVDFGLGACGVQHVDKPADNLRCGSRGERLADRLAGAGLQHHLVPPLVANHAGQRFRRQQCGEARAADGVGFDGDLVAFLAGYALEELGHVVVEGEAVADKEHALLGRGGQQDQDEGEREEGFLLHGC